MIDRKNETKYVKDRLCLKRQNYMTIYSEDTFALIPFSCPVCDTVLRTQDDEHSYEKFQCCSFCAINWAYPNVERWKNGWRPDKNDASELAGQQVISTKLSF